MELFDILLGYIVSIGIFVLGTFVHDETVIR